MTDTPDHDGARVDIEAWRKDSEGALRHLMQPHRRQDHERIPALLARLAEVEAERDYHHARADVLLAKVSGGVALRGGKPGDYWAEWHRTHCAAAQGAAEALARAEAAEIERDAALAEAIRENAQMLSVQDELHEALTSIAEHKAAIADMRRRKEAAEAVVARVEALADEWEVHQRPRIRYSAQRLRAALADATPDPRPDATKSPESAERNPRTCAYCTGRGPLCCLTIRGE